MRILFGAIAAGLVGAGPCANARLFRKILHIPAFFVRHRVTTIMRRAITSSDACPPQNDGGGRTVRGPPASSANTIPVGEKPNRAYSHTPGNTAIPVLSAVRVAAARSSRWNGNRICGKPRTGNACCCVQGTWLPAYYSWFAGKSGLGFCRMVIQVFVFP